MITWRQKLQLLVAEHTEHTDNVNGALLAAALTDFLHEWTASHDEADLEAAMVERNNALAKIEVLTGEVQDLRTTRGLLETQRDTAIENNDIFQRRAECAAREKREAFERSDGYYERLNACRCDLLGYKLAMARLLRDEVVSEEHVVAVGIPLDSVK